LIDLHSHTTASDGTSSPAELIAEASRIGLEALAITDHDTFAGYEHAQPYAREAGVDLIRGIELSTKLNGHSVHLLGYFLRPARDGFADWVLEMQRSRRDRNVRLVARLREFGFDIIRQAFDEYLDESAKGYVQRIEPQLVDAIRRVRQAGGIASLAHPGRIQEPLETLLPRLCAAGLNAIEAYHSDHTPDELAYYLSLADRFGLLATGGSDFHGDLNPGLCLGTGHGGNVHVPKSVLDNLRASVT
jgi:predicted metal-dependent phosphoesterase TrpH